MNSRFEEYFREYSRLITSAVENDRIRIGLRRSINAYENKRRLIFAQFKYIQKLAVEVRKIKEYSIAHMDELVNQAREAIEENHGFTYLCKNAEEVYRVIDNIIGSDKLVVKSKSITTEEIALREHLEALHNEVYETDLGEFIIQQLKSRSMHLVTPAIHIPREDVAMLLEKLTGKHLDKDNVTGMVNVVRELLREKYSKADFGISGANVVAADTGTVFIIENEGNARIVTGVPPVHIVVVGIDKIVPHTLDAFKVAQVIWHYAGYKVPQYISMIAGPSATSDIEKVKVYGAHGPKEFHVIFLDNNRTTMAKTIFKEALYCLRCGACMYECPVYQVTAGYYGKKYMGGIGAIWDTFILGKEAAAPEAFTCTLCGKCKLVCPMEIDVPHLTPYLRAYVRGTYEIK